MLTLELRYFASVREALGLERERVELADGDWDIAALQTHLAARGGSWTETFAGRGKLLCAVDQSMARPTTALTSGMEVAFFPPVTGG